MLSYTNDMKAQKIFTSAGLQRLCDDMARGALTEKSDDPASFDMEQAQSLIIEALAFFDETLAARARDFFETSYRLQSKYVSQGNMRQMHCVPSGMDGNQGPAIIEMDFDRSIDAVIILAHELGHALADDIGKEAGHDFFKNPLHMHETQAYTLQHIVSQFLLNHSNPKTAKAAKAQLAMGMVAMDAIAKSSLVAADVLQKTAMNEDFNTVLLMDEHFGTGWEVKMHDHRHMHCARVISRVFEQAESLSYLQDERLVKAHHKLGTIKDAIFDRPASFYAALGVVKHALSPDSFCEAENNASVLSVLGKEGPKPLQKTLYSIGIEDEEGLRACIVDNSSSVHQKTARQDPKRKSILS